ncbi:MAG TPA: 5-oxoprolinase subunit PxpB [Bacillota bacterium]|nr:5-oxoprolinase subunit PxpB [Bacillota bacterium]
MNDLKHLTVYPLGDHALTIQLSESIDNDIHQFILQMTETLEQSHFIGFIEVIPSYHNFTVFYDPIRVYNHYHETTHFSPFHFVKDFCLNTLKAATNISSTEKNIIDIPVIYGDEYGPDLDYVASYNGLDHETVIQLHSEKLYLVYMLGFAPGFPYFANVNEKIVTPRKKTPRQNNPAGSVGLAGNQTGIYSIASPGGWQVIGNTPVKLFTPTKEHPSLLKPGDYVRFKPINQKTYDYYKEEYHYGN